MAHVDSLRTFEGAVALVTGGASGIGRAIGESLARRGARVVLADLQVDLAKEIAARIKENGGQATALALDVTDYPATSQLVQNTYQSLGRLDYVFNIAGIGIVGEARYYAIEDWCRVLDVNLRGVVHGVHAAYPIMLRQGFGHIVNMASGAGLWPSPFVVSYCASKHAVVGLSTSLRIEAAAARIRVSVLCPGAVRNPGAHRRSEVRQSTAAALSRGSPKVGRTSTPHATGTVCRSSPSRRGQEPSDHRHPIHLENPVVAQPFVTEPRFLSGAKIVGDREAEHGASAAPAMRDCSPRVRMSTRKAVANTQCAVYMSGSIFGPWLTCRIGWVGSMCCVTSQLVIEPNHPVDLIVTL